MRRTQAERTETTVGALLRAARKRFAELGYDATSLDDVVADAELTKGALYHHFGSKRDLFRAVYEREQEDLMRMIGERVSQEASAWGRLRRGCRAFVALSLEPGTQRITLIDAPIAIGWEGMRDIEAVGSLRLLRAGLRQSMQDGEIAARPVEPLAYLLFGALCEGAMTAARAADPKAAAGEVADEVERLLDAVASANVP